MNMRRSPSFIFALFGTATLVGGAAADVDAGCLTAPDSCTIILSRNTPGGTLGFLSAPVSGRGASDTTFDIASSNGADTSTVNWMAVPKNIGSGSSTLFTNNASLRRPPSGKFVQRGVATLVGGTITVTAKPFSAQARVFVLTRQPAGANDKLSAPVASVNASAGTFVINSASGAETSTVDWVVIDEPIRFSQSGPRMSQAKGSLASGTAYFSSMNPMLDTEISVLASVITPSTPGNLSCPNAGRAPTLTDGSILIASSASEASLIECIVF